MTTTAPSRWARGGPARHRLLAVVLVVGLGLTVVSLGALVNHMRIERRDSIVQRFNIQIAAATDFIEAYVRQIESHETTVAKENLSGRVTQESLTRLTTLNQLERAALYDGDGNLLRKSPAGGQETMNSSERAGLESALGAIASVTAVTGATGQRASTIAFAVPFETPTGPRVFTGRYSAEDTLLRPFVANALNSYRTGQVYLVTPAGVVIVADRRDDAGQALSRVSPDLARGTAAGRQGFLGAEGRYFVTRPVGGTDWRLIYTLETTELFETVTPAQIYVPWAILVAFSLMGLGVIRLFVGALTGRARAEDARTRQEAILEAAGDAFIGLDDAGRITDWNSAATRLLGRSRTEVLGKPVLSLGIVPDRTDRPDRPELHWAEFEQFLRTQASSARRSETLTVHHRDGHPIPVELAVAITLWEAHWRVHAFIRDVTERLEHERQLHELALTDPLTGLANRRGFIDQLDRAHGRLQRHHTPFAVLYADVDKFKSINDNFGHAAGDSVLRHVSTRLRTYFRAEDTVGRLGGDEFAVIFEASPADIDGIVSRLRQVLAEPYEHKDQVILASVSIGLAVPNQDESASHLLERADHVMYSAKKQRQ